MQQNFTHTPYQQVGWLYYYLRSFKYHQLVYTHLEQAQLMTWYWLKHILHSG